MGFINKLSHANLYIGTDNLHLKVEEIELPNLVQVSSTQELLGALGKVELMDGYEEMTGKIIFASVYPEILKVISDPTTLLEIQVRGNLETHSNAGLVSEVPVTALMTVRFKEIQFGTFKQHEAVKQEAPYSCFYFKYTIDGNDIIEFDPISNILKVNGVDKMENARRNLAL